MMTGALARPHWVASVVVGLLVVATPAAVAAQTTESRTVQLGAATAVTAAIELGVGDLELTGGARELLEAEFTYDRPERRPEVAYHVADGDGILTVRQPGMTESAETEARNEWALRMGSAAPMGLSIEVGAGDATLDLSALSLTDLDVDTGAGDLVLRLAGGDLLERADVNLGAGTAIVDLTGRWQKDCYVRLNLGVGTVSVVVPRTIGVRLDADTGIGSVRVEGLSREGDGYRNQAYGKAPTSIVLAVNVGVGEISIETGE